MVVPHPWQPEALFHGPHNVQNTPMVTGNQSFNTPTAMCVEVEECVGVEVGVEVELPPVLAGEPVEGEAVAPPPVKQ